MQKLAVCIGIILIGLGFPSVQCQLEPEDVEKIDAFFEELLQCRPLTGMAVSLVKDREVAFTKGYGYANVERQDPVTADSLFSIGSISKSITTVLLAKVFAEEVDMGLNWDSIVSQSTDDIIYFYDGYVTNHTTFRDLVSHKTGISATDALTSLGGVDTREQIIERTGFFVPVVEFRTGLVYSNVKFTIAMYPVERYTSLTYEELLKQRLLDPLDMESTMALADAIDQDNPNLATSYFWDISEGGPGNVTEIPMEIYEGYDLITAGTTLSTSANDMGKWMRFLLNDGVTIDGTSLIAPEDLHRLWSAETAVKLGPIENAVYPLLFQFSNYGLGYYIGHYRGHRVPNHGGSVGGYKTYMSIYPENGIGVFVATNFEDGTQENYYASSFLSDILLGIEPAYNSSYVCDILNDGGTVHDSKFPLRQTCPESSVDILRQLGFDEEVIRYMADYNGHRGMSYNVAVKLSEIIDRYKSGIVETRQVENYTGIYGHFAYGNVTITSSAACEGCLFMEYGKLGRHTLYPSENSENQFLGVNEYPAVIYTTPVVFWGNNTDGYQYVSPLFFDYALPPIFERGLNMADARLPDLDKC